MLIPIGCDRPGPHGTGVTWVLIAVNVVVFIAQVMTGEGGLTQWIYLPYGEGFTPIQWVTSSFAHGDIIHLIGNMIFLYVFGSVVENHIGQPRYLMLYAWLAIIPSILEQIIMWQGSYVPGSLGASGVIFGLIVCATWWVPRVEINFWFFIFLTVGRFNAELFWVGLWYVGWELLYLWLDDWQISSAMLHLIGAIAALPAAWAFLKWGWVEGGAPTIANYFTGKGSAGPSPRQREESRMGALAAKVADHWTDGNVRKALRAYEALVADRDAPPVEAGVSRAIIQWLRKQQRDDEIRPLAEAHLRHFPDDGTVRLEWALVLARHQNRPDLALRQIQAIDPTSLSAAQRQYLARFKQQLESHTASHARGTARQVRPL